jgi:hypothetical protein
MDCKLGVVNNGGRRTECTKKMKKELVPILCVMYYTLIQNFHAYHSENKGI